MSDVSANNPDGNEIFSGTKEIADNLKFNEAALREWIGDNISNFISLFSTELQPYILLATIYFITMVLTEISSNVATAIIMVPIAIAVSNQLGLESRPFVFTVAFAASSSFITPIGYQTNLMVYGPGGYKFSDYIRVGLPLSLILFISAVLIIPRFWSF